MLCRERSSPRCCETFWPTNVPVFSAMVTGRGLKFVSPMEGGGGGVRSGFNSWRAESSDNACATCVSSSPKPKEVGQRDSVGNEHPVKIITGLSKDKRKIFNSILGTTF